MATTGRQWGYQTWWRLEPTWVLPSRSLPRVKAGLKQRRQGGAGVSRAPSALKDRIPAARPHRSGAPLPFSPHPTLRLERAVPGI